jgi:hypothetical protein
MWTVQQNQCRQGAVTLTSKGVLLSRPGSPGNAEDVIYNGDNIALAQGGLTGDFHIIAKFEDFQPGAPQAFVGPEFEAGVYWRTAEGSIWQATGQVGCSTAQAILINGHDFLQKLLDPTPNPNTLVGAAATVDIKRESGMVTVTTTVNGQSTSEMSTAPFTEEPLTFAIGIGSSGNSERWDDSSVLLTSVTIEGGGGAVKSDTFHCSP